MQLALPGLDFLLFYQKQPLHRYLERRIDESVPAASPQYHPPLAWIIVDYSFHSLSLMFCQSLSLRLNE